MPCHQTAAALTFGIYMLCQHPHVLKRLREEIAEHVGFQRRPTYDDVRNMKYLRAFLNGENPSDNVGQLGNLTVFSRDAPALPPCVSLHECQVCLRSCPAYYTGRLISGVPLHSNV